MTDVILRISGMDCGACAVRIVRVLQGLPGLREVSVSDTAGCACLTYDEMAVDLGEIARRVQRAGFDVPVGMAELRCPGAAAGAEARLRAVFGVRSVARAGDTFTVTLWPVGTDAAALPAVLGPGTELTAQHGGEETLQGRARQRLARWLGLGVLLKNIGMGCGSRAGKEEMHSSGKPVVDTDKCIGCGKCVENCAHNGPHIENGKCTILKYKCTGCGRCINVCPMHAIHADYAIANELLNCKIAEYAKAVVDGRPSFHIALAVDVSPCCDCHNFSDVPIVPNVGMFASFDPVALDTACADMINVQPVNPNSVIAHEHDHPHDHFTAAHPDTDWRAAVEHGEAIGLGTTHYELVTV